MLINTLINKGFKPLFLLFESQYKIPTNNIVNYDPTPDEKRKFQSKIIPFHTMYIMADLSTSKKYTLHFQVQLFSS